MLDLSFTEITVVLAVALFVFDHKDLVKIIKQCRKFKNFIHTKFNEYCKDLDLEEQPKKEIKNILDDSPEIKEIVDLTGEVRQAYSVNHLDEILNSKEKGDEGNT